MLCVWQEVIKHSSPRGFTRSSKLVASSSQPWRPWASWCKTAGLVSRLRRYSRTSWTRRCCIWPRRCSWTRLYYRDIIRRDKSRHSAGERKHVVSKNSVTMKKTSVVSYTRIIALPSPWEIVDIERAQLHRKSCKKVLRKMKIHQKKSFLISTDSPTALLVCWNWADLRLSIAAKLHPLLLRTRKWLQIRSGQWRRFKCKDDRHSDRWVL